MRIEETPRSLDHVAQSDGIRGHLTHHTDPRLQHQKRAIGRIQIERVGYR